MNIQMNVNMSLAQLEQQINDNTKKGNKIINCCIQE